MKKLLILGLTLLVISSALFADDAKVMPTRVGRIYLAPSFVYGTQYFDDEGSREDSGQTLKVFNLGAALEYGVINWITAALQWTPGINLWSDIDKEGSDDTINAFGVGDLFVGAKMQILGSAGLMKNDNLRLAFALGVKVPLPGPDYEDQFKNMMAGDAYTGGNVDRHVLGLGLRTYFDYIINDNFFINFYNQFIYFPMKGDLEKAGLAEYATLYMTNANLAATSAALGIPNHSIDGEVSYGYDLTFELEPVFSIPVAPGTIFSAGLPINYQTFPGKKYDFSASGPSEEIKQAGLTGIKNALPDGEQSHLLTVKPNVGIFFMGWAMPVEFKLNYFAPVWGKNSSANHTFNFQARLYFRI